MKKTATAAEREGFMMAKAMIHAHRGASGHAPENTLAAFRKAILLGSDGIECDIHLSGDGVYMVCHDDTADRTSNGSGKLSDYTVEELKKLDFGSKYSADFAGEPIPTLHEMLCVVHDMDPINIEIKCLGNNTDEEIDAFYQFLVDERVLERVLISCFNGDLLVRMKELHPDLRCGWLCYGEDVKRSIDLAVAGKLDAIHPDFYHVDEAYIREAHANGIQINVWTVNDPKDIQAMLDLECDGIITNYPDRARALIG